ncbi:MAG TPA: DUF3108 domain-containing protein [Stellaceae bacterium]|nr:DUF3108 domain-containing protein [Stellaceae bacterium]
MKRIRRALRSGIAAAFLLGLGAGAAPAAQSDRFDMRFEIYGIAGMHLVTNRTSVETSGTRYAIAMSLTTRGLAGIFVKLDSHSQTHGSLVGGRVVPEEYGGEVRRNGKDQQTRVDYGADGTIANDWNSPRIEQAAYVPAAQTRGTVDQLTAYFILERQLAARNTCNATIPVFDGLHRYDLHFVDAPPQPLPENVVRYFPGPVQVCRMIRTQISGPADHEGTSSGKIWYARLGRSGRMLPVQMQFDTELGAVKGYLAALHGDGLDLHLIK